MLPHSPGKIGWLCGEGKGFQQDIGNLGAVISVQDNGSWRKVRERAHIKDSYKRSESQKKKCRICHRKGETSQEC